MKEERINLRPYFFSKVNGIKMGINILGSSKILPNPPADQLTIPQKVIIKKIQNLSVLDFSVIRTKNTG
jgi:hypothetical protein